MAIDIASRRNAAMLDQMVLLPDGSVDNQDRASLLGQYTPFKGLTELVLNITAYVFGEKAQTLFVDQSRERNVYVSRTKSFDVER